MATTLRCSGCGAVAPGPREAPYPFRCAAAAPGDDIDHIVQRVLDPRGTAFPAGDEMNPFVRFRTLFHAYHTAIAGGVSDADYVALVQAIDAKVVAASGRGFRVNPLARHDALSDALGFEAGGGVWLKDETGNPGDSHKSLHLMGILIYLEVIERLGLSPSKGDPPPLAIASCGNAALAAGVLAQAVGRDLRTFIPPEADPLIVSRLRGLGAEAVFCPRKHGELGDPCVHELRRAVQRGAIPFACVGADAGLTIDGGATLGAELAADGPPFDRVFLQTGGGALASAVIQGFEDALALGRTSALPRVHPVQARAVSPLARSWERVAARVLERMGEEPEGTPRARADRVRGADPSLIDEELRYAATHRAEFMWPWEEEPRSVAGAIIDDETYDWVACVRGMLRSGGYPISVEEETFTRANQIAQKTTGIPIGPSGSAGLAGVVQIVEQEPSLLRERVAVIFSGIRG